MSNIFNPSGGTTTVTDLSGNNWKALYTNGSGTVTELALGADGTTLVGNGTSSAPTFGNLTDLKGGNDKVLFTNSSGVLTELAIGASGTYLKSAGTTSNPTWATAGGNWAEIAKGTYTAGSATLIDISSLSNYRSIRGWYTIPETDNGDYSWLKSTVNGLSSNYYSMIHSQLGSTAYLNAMGSTSSYAGNSRNFYTGFGEFQVYFLAEGKATTNRASIAGNFQTWSRFDQSDPAGTTGAFENWYWINDSSLTSDTGITAFTLSLAATSRTVEVNSGYNAFYVEGYTQS
jgi:hypothetical protein